MADGKNNPKENFEKGLTNLVLVIIAGAISISTVKALKVAGIDIDNAQLTLALTALLGGALAAAENWWTHRK